MENELLASDGTNFDLEWSIFHAALRSYKSEIYLGKEINEYANKDILEKIWLQLGHCKRTGIEATEDAQKFHRTVLEKQKFRLSISSSQEMDELLQKFHGIKKSLESFDMSKMMLFKVNYNLLENNDNCDRFSEKYGSFIALHGSPVNRFYSILQNGLHLPKSSDDPGLYGFGIYLTNKLDVALHFAQPHLFDCGWLNDESIKIVAVCQVAKHPTAVVRKEHKTSDGFSFDSGIPPDYFLVKDECMVRVTHIMVETSCQVSFLQSRARSQHNNQLSSVNIFDTFAAIFRRNWLLYTIAVYVAVLIIIACFKGRYVIFSDWDTSDLMNIND